MVQWLGLCASTASGKEFACQFRSHERWVLSLGHALGGGHGNPLQYSWLENLMDSGAWWATVHRVAELDMRDVS